LTDLRPYSPRIFKLSPFPFSPPAAGPPSEEDCYADIEAAYHYLRHSLRVPSQNIVLYGRSLGSGPSCYLATKTALLAQQREERQRRQRHDDEDEDAEHAVEDDLGDGPVGGLILHAPFLSVYRVVIDAGCTLYGDKFVNLDIIPMVRSPTLLIHGTSDQIVPFHHSERLLEAIPKPYQARPLYIEGMSHNNVHAQVRPMFVDRLTDYLREHVWPGVVAVQQQQQQQQHRQIKQRYNRSNSLSSSPSGVGGKNRIWKLVADNDADSASATDDGDYDDDDYERPHPTGVDSRQQRYAVEVR